MERWRHWARDVHVVSGRPIVTTMMVSLGARSTPTGTSLPSGSDEAGRTQVMDREPSETTGELPENLTGLMPTKVWSVPVVGSDENEFDIRIRILRAKGRWPRRMLVDERLGLFWED